MANFGSPFGSLCLHDAEASGGLFLCAERLRPSGRSQPVTLRSGITGAIPLVTLGVRRDSCRAPSNARDPYPCRPTNEARQAAKPATLGEVSASAEALFLDLCRGF